MPDDKPSKPARSEQQNAQLMSMLAAHERRIYSYILSMTPDWSVADDILQETFVKVWEQYDRYEPGTNFGAWACTIARYQILSYRKTMSRSRVMFSSEFMEAIADEQQAQSDQFDNRREALEHCLKRLDERGRDMLRMFYEPRSTIEDVARRAGKSTNATYHALRRMRQLLLECIERQIGRPDAK